MQQSFNQRTKGATMPRCTGLMAILTDCQILAPWTPVATVPYPSSKAHIMRQKSCSCNEQRSTLAARKACKREVAAVIAAAALTAAARFRVLARRGAQVRPLPFSLLLCLPVLHARPPLLSDPKHDALSGLRARPGFACATRTCSLIQETTHEQRAQCQCHITRQSAL